MYNTSSTTFSLHAITLSMNARSHKINVFFCFEYQRELKEPLDSAFTFPTLRGS